MLPRDNGLDKLLVWSATLPLSKSNAFGRPLPCEGAVALRRSNALGRPPPFALPLSPRRLGAVGDVTAAAPVPMFCWSLLTSRTPAQPRTSRLLPLDYRVWIESLPESKSKRLLSRKPWKSLAFNVLEHISTLFFLFLFKKRKRG